MRVEFLTLDEVLSLHADQVARYGGSALVRDLGLLESALAMPAATFGGELLHPSRSPRSSRTRAMPTPKASSKPRLRHWASSPTTRARISTDPPATPTP